MADSSSAPAAPPPPPPPPGFKGVFHQAASDANVVTKPTFMKRTTQKRQRADSQPQHAEELPPLRDADIGAFRRQLNAHARKISKKWSALSDVCGEAGGVIAHLLDRKCAHADADIRRIVEALTSIKRKGFLDSSEHSSNDAPRQYSEDVSKRLTLPPPPGSVEPQPKRRSKWRSDDSSSDDDYDDHDRDDSRDLSMESSWLWVSEHFHDAHLSESIVMKIRFGRAELVEYRFFEKPSHHNFGGGRFKQSELKIHWNVVAALAKSLGLANLLSALLLGCCIGLHGGSGNDRCRLLDDVVFKHVDKLKVPANTPRSAKRIQVIVIDKQNGAPIYDNTDDLFVYDAPPLNTKPSSLRENIDNARFVASW